MKRFKTTGKLLKTLVFSSLLAACNNEQIVEPTNMNDTTVNDQNARISPLLRLVDDSGHSIQYIKTGKYFGKVSRVNKTFWYDYYSTYTYNDNAAGELWISKKKYVASNNSFVSEHKYKVVNGLCVQSHNDSDDNFEYKYNPQGYLDEVKKFNQGLLSDSWKYQYDGAYRLIKIKHQKDGKPFHTYNFTYTQIEDKYPLNYPADQLFNLSNQYIGGYYIGGISDKYLPYFGKHTSTLVDVMTDHNDITNKIMTGASIYFSNYVVGSNGLITSKNYTQYSATSTEKFKYSSTSWQGI